jgi:hypothetical protein
VAAVEGGVALAAVGAGGLTEGALGTETLTRGTPATDTPASWVPEEEVPEEDAPGEDPPSTDTLTNGALEEDAPGTETLTRGARPTDTLMVGAAARSGDAWGGLGGSIAWARAAPGVAHRKMSNATPALAASLERTVGRRITREPWRG